MKQCKSAHKSSYPIQEVVPQLRECLRHKTIAILSSPPGSGKTTILPLELLDEGWTAKKKIVVLQPRRLAVRTVAARMAELLNQRVGETVGYRVRHENVTGAATRIEVMTEGILIRKMQQDPELKDTALIIFDEFHERSLNSDLALAFAREIQGTLRPELRLLLMSATISGQMLPPVYGPVETISGGYRLFPVEILHPEISHERFIPAQAVSGLRRAFFECEKDVLVFLPGVNEIRKTAELFRPIGGPGVVIFELYGDLPYAAQKQAILPDPDGRRKVILSTPIAETSITIENVSAVVDSGWEKISRFNPGRGGDSLELQRISQDSADQRAGRAGRLAPGKCYRLYRGELIRSREPEILRADLAPLSLELAAWGVRDWRSLAWIDPPPEGAMQQAIELLTRLELLDAGGTITARGRQAARLPAHPRLCNMMIEAAGDERTNTACDLAAILEERDFTESRSVSIEDRLEILRASRTSGRVPEKIKRSVLERIEKASKQFAENVKRIGSAAGSPKRWSPGMLLSFAYPDRVAKRRTESLSDARYLLASGGGARSVSNSALSRAPYIVIADMKVRGADSEILLAAEILEEELLERFAGQLISERLVGWDPQSGATNAETVLRLGSLILQRKPLTNLDPEERSAMLIRGIREGGGLSLLNWDEEARNIRTRMLLFEKFYPELGIASVSDEPLLASLEEWLLPHIAGLSRLTQVEKVALAEPILGRYSWQLRQKLEKCLPANLVLPSGKSRRLEFDIENGVVLRATVQELFGWRDSPAIGEGRIPLMLHILSPARRPIQVTKDLRSFWANTYQQVRKELRGRYPKHKWPEDPLS